MKISRLTALMILLALLSITLAATHTVARRSGERNVFDQLNLLVDVRHELAARYVEQPDEQQLVDAALRGMVGVLNDPYTEYYNHDELADFNKQIHGEFSGIGAEVNIEQDKLQIASPLEDSPAWRAGVLADDIVLEIDDTPVTEIFTGKTTRNQKLRAAIDRLTGPAGTAVHLLVQHKTGQQERISVTRRKIDIPTVKGVRRSGENGHWDFMLDGQNRIGYIRLTQFTHRSVADFQLAVKQLQKQKARGLIIDLRFNPGGLLQGAVELSQMFLEANQRIVSIKGRAEKEKVFTAHADQPITDLPLIVLANEYSASASEIVTGALADNGRAKFVGARTFGKGSVQTTKLLLGDQGDELGMLKFTNAYYYLPNGRNIHRRPDQTVWGVDPEPGFYVPMNAEQIEQMIKLRRERDVLRQHKGEDTTGDLTPDDILEQMADLQLAAALTAIQGKLLNGDWSAVGGENVNQLALQTRRDNLVRRRDLLQQGLAGLEEELAKLDTQINEPDPESEESGPSQGG